MLGDMTEDEWVDVAELQPTQEEAESLLLHELLAGSACLKVVTVTNDDTHCCYGVSGLPYPLCYLPEVLDFQPFMVCRYYKTAKSIV